MLSGDVTFSHGMATLSLRLPPVASFEEMTAIAPDGLCHAILCEEFQRENETATLVRYVRMEWYLLPEEVGATVGKVMEFLSHV